MAEVKAPALSPNKLRAAEFVRTTLVAEIAPGVSIESVLVPEFWGHCARQLKPYARVECRAQDNKWQADLMVKSVSKTEASMWVLNYVDLEAQGKDGKTEDGAEEYTVSFAPRQRWRVIRKSDGAVIHKDEATEAEAREWLSDHLKQPA